MTNIEAVDIFFVELKVCHLVESLANEVHNGMPAKKNKVYPSKIAPFQQTSSISAD